MAIRDITNRTIKMTSNIHEAYMVLWFKDRQLRLYLGINSACSFNIISVMNSMSTCSIQTVTFYTLHYFHVQLQISSHKILIACRRRNENNHLCMVWEIFINFPGHFHQFLVVRFVDKRAASSVWPWSWIRLMNYAPRERCVSLAW